MKEIDKILEQQNKFFHSGATLSIKYRKEVLKNLYAKIKLYENEICCALQEDLGKSEYESYMCEIGLVYTEITYMLKHIKKFAKPQKVHTPLSQFASKSYKLAVPYGNVLIISPWNYPFLLTFGPLVDAISAGNTALIKPSSYSPNVSKVIEKIMLECFSENYVKVVQGGRKENSILLSKKFNFVFFTGSQNVGKEVLRKSAENLTPVILELGGKSPCIVDRSAKIKLAAKRIVFGKFINCGQTCVAPDYILCDKLVKDELIKEIVNEIQIQYGKDVFNNNLFGKIINEKHFNRLCKLINKDKLVYGGRVNKEKLQIEPTILNNVNWADAVMQEEIFGPILPILTYDNINEVYNTLENKAKPLALYIFSQNKSTIKDITTKISYGGGCVNDCVVHLATTEMGFGGVWESGMGSYHGKTGFYAFSHVKSILDKKTWIDLPIRYQPYKNNFLKKLLKFFLK